MVIIGTKENRERESGPGRKKRIDGWKEGFIESLPSCSVTRVHGCIVANNPHGYDKLLSMCGISFDW